MNAYFYLLIACVSILCFEVFSNLAITVENSSQFQIDLLHAPPIYYCFVLGAIYSIYSFIYCFRKLHFKVLSLLEDKENGGVRYRNVQTV
jgi:hypothetical protein